MDLSLESTYKELKHEYGLHLFCGEQGLESTYKELKPTSPNKLFEAISWFRVYL